MVQVIFEMQPASTGVEPILCPTGGWRLSTPVGTEAGARPEFGVLVRSEVGRDCNGAHTPSGEPGDGARERDEVVETLPADAANQSFAMSICLRSQH